MNVYLCLTPLQCVIAEVLIKKDVANCFFVYIVDSDNEKSKAYYQRLKEASDDGVYFVLSKNRFFNILKLINLMRKLNKNVNNVFLASIDNIYMHISLSYLKYKEIYTFDDGFANIYKSGLYYLENSYPLYKRILYKIFGGRVTMKEIKKKTKKHFSIYPRTISNIVSADLVEEIEIFPVKSYLYGDEKKNLKNKTIKIFAGQPLFFSDDEKSKEIILSAISYIKPDFYFPHPRESFSIGDVESINTSLIIEDFVIHSLINKPDTKFEIYSFFSSCLVNLYNVDNVSVIAIRCELLPYDEIYSLISEFSIKIIELEN
ncbi:glycosyltransferase family 52 [Pectobacterium versatile]|uniref:glycosyltransferase family 52 n=1 Tax=Pectobacterium versatile TaxID=2488639 RepID=UPI0038696011